MTHHETSRASEMDLRDNFAGQTFGHLIAAAFASGDKIPSYERLAISAYRAADALIAVRDKKL